MNVIRITKQNAMRRQLTVHLITFYVSKEGKMRDKVAKIKTEFFVKFYLISLKDFFSLDYN